MELIVDLPDPLAKEAKGAGLLAPQAIEKLLREAIERRKQLDAFFATVERLRAANIPPMSEEGIQAEINAVRAQRRAARQHANRHA